MPKTEDEENVMMNCGTCIYSEPVINECAEHGTDLNLECFRFPPTPVSLGDGMMMSCRTVIQSHDWCGEHMASPDAERGAAASCGCVFDREKTGMRVKPCSAGVDCPTVENAILDALNNDWTIIIDRADHIEG